MKILSEKPLIRAYCCDCMDLMAGKGDGFYSLAICDPPYGIGSDGSMNMGSERNTITFYKQKDWDIVPDESYFVELFRISKHQIIWGGNYFDLPPSQGFAIWDKKIGNNDFAMCEYAWISIQRSSKLFSMCGTHLT